jgi:hypothetical protein
VSRQPHILNASTNLLGICFVIITGLKLTGSNSLSWADEIAWIASLLFLVSVGLSYLALRGDGRAGRTEVWAERVFLCGVATLTTAILVMAVFIEVGGPVPARSSENGRGSIAAFAALPQPRP